MLSHGVNVEDNAGHAGFDSCYFVLGDGLDYLYLSGVTLSQVHAGDFIV